MAKRGSTKHLKRIASPKAIPVHDRKERTWMTRHMPGPHPKRKSVPLGVLLRDVLKLATTLREIRRVLARKLVLIDGKPRSDEKFPVGLMDVISMPKAEKHFRMVVDTKGRIVPVEIGKGEAAVKLLKVTGKHTIRGGKLNVTFHDGRNMLADNHLKVGDTVLVSLPEAKLKSHLKRDKGSRCLVIEGKHAGSMVKLKDLMERKGGKPSEALVQGKDEEFITVAKYLFVVDEAFKGEGA